MRAALYDLQPDEDDFGPGTALVLSLFAVLLLIAALVYAQDQGGGHAPVTMSVMSEATSSFRPGDYTLEQSARDDIRKQVESARRQTRFNHIQVIGYASPEGSNNRELSARRAESVRDYMVQHLGVPDECVIVATFSDSHSPSLRAWLDQPGHSLEMFRQAKAAEQKILVGEKNLGAERRVAILGVYHKDSNCRLDKILPQ